MRKVLLIILAILAGGFLLPHLVPYGRNHSNPPVKSEPTWDSPQTRELAERACYDCHSNETKWPWYSNLAPVSWLVQRDVEEGRHKLNFSEWGSGEEEGEEMAESIYKDMPPKVFLITHPEALLTDAKKQILAQGLALTGGGEYEREGQETDEQESREHEEDEADEHEEDD
jgi:hypothetical protein